VDEAVLKALEKEPDRRWPTAKAFARALNGTQPALAEGADSRSASGLHERYELGERIGTGRLGSEVWAGRHRAIGSPVVIRILRRGASPAWETGRTRFLREARAMQVAHPSILEVRDFGEQADLVYVVTDRVAGSSLRQLIDAEGPLAWARSRRFTLDLLSAGRALHRHGGLIFGITPAIVRVHSEDAEERLVVSSAGIAEVQDVLGDASEERLRALQIPNSELLYVAPEVLLGEEPDGRTDIYSVGVIAYEMLTGRPPFTADTVPQLIARIFSAAFEPVRELAPDVPDEGAQVIARCLSQRPDRRFTDLAEFEAAWIATPSAAADSSG
jgi:serine/threonine-protein kinase